MNIENFTRVLRPPATPIENGSAEEWAIIERHIGTELPQDYKDFVNTFGTGYIGAFIWIFNPFARKPTLNLPSQIRVRLDALREIKQQLPGDVSYRLFPEPGGLLPCGATGNGDCLYWLTGDNPDKWPILVNESRGPDWARFNMGVTDFLAGVLRRDIVCNIFPPDFPGQPMEFASRA